MTYTAGSTIVATDYNGFVSTTAGANVNATWNSTYGQTAISTVSTGGSVTATQWATLVNTIASMGNHQPTTITSRAAPTAGTTISILAAVNTDITNCYNNRLNAYASGSQYTGWTGINSKTSATGSGTAAWSIVFINDVNFVSGEAAKNYFFGAGGIIRLQFSKTSTGTDIDPDWNAFATACGTLSFTGTSTSKTIAGVSYQGTNKIAGSGTPTNLATTIGAAQLTGSNQEIFLQYIGGAYSSSYIQVLAYNLSASVIRFTANWVQPAVSGAGQTNNISGGTAASGATPGTAPCTICTYFPPETTYLSNTWGTPTVAATTT
jgi:hypothetical protein